MVHKSVSEPEAQASIGGASGKVCTDWGRRAAGAPANTSEWKFLDPRPSSDSSGHSTRKSTRTNSSTAKSRAMAHHWRPSVETVPVASGELATLELWLLRKMGLA